MAQFINIDQTADGVCVEINSSATNAPLINFTASSSNIRGDIAFGIVRTTDPSTTTEGDLWYNSTDNVFKYYDGVAIRTFGTSTVGSLQDAYDGGNTITGTNAIQITQSSPSIVSALTITQNNTDNSANIVTISGSSGGNALYVRQSTAIGEGLLVDIGTTYSDGAGIGLNVNSRSTTNASGPLLVLTKGYTDTFTGNIAVALIKQSSAGGTQPILKIQEEGLGNSTYGIIDIVATRAGNQATGIRIHHSASTGAASATTSAQAILIEFESSRSGSAIIEVNNTAYANSRVSLYVESSSTANTGAVYINQLGNGVALNIDQTITSAAHNVIDVTTSGSGYGLNLTHAGTAGGRGINITKGGTSGQAIYISINSSSNNSAAIYIENGGTGYSLNLQHTNTASVNQVINIANSGSGNDVSATNWHVTKAGGFQGGVTFNSVDKTISSGAITIGYGDSLIFIAPETGTTDTLDTISGGRNGQVVILMRKDTSGQITVSEAGNIDDPGTVELNSNSDTATYIYRSSISKWCMISFRDNA